MNPLELTPPPLAALRVLLDEHAPLRPVPHCPEIRAFYGNSLVAVWEAAERLAGTTLPAPFWAYPWAGGIALARLILDQPERVRGRTVLDFGAGGGVAAVAAAAAGAAHVVANDIDPWALATCALAAEVNGVTVETLHADLCAASDLPPGFDLVLCSDLAYERSEAPRQKRVLQRARDHGCDILVADAGRAYFETDADTLLLEIDVDVPLDLEGVATRRARVFQG